MLLPVCNFVVKVETPKTVHLSNLVYEMIVLI
jgi:hypothetical protein